MHSSLGYDHLMLSPKLPARQDSTESLLSLFPFRNPNTTGTVLVMPKFSEIIGMNRNNKIGFLGGFLDLL